MRPLILLTNDDGITSPGLRAAAEAVADLGDLLVVAPSTQQTSMSRAFTRGPDVGQVVQVPFAVAGREVPAYAVTGSPVLAVAHALLELAPRLPDLCVSGINYGENCGAAITVSGTVGAALEAELYGVPSIASSLQVDVSEWHGLGEQDWAAAGHFTRLLASQVLADGLPEEVGLLNLNVPRGATTATPVRRTVQSRQRYYVQAHPGERTLSDPVRLRVSVQVDDAALEPDSDVWAVTRDGVVSVTPLGWSMTAQTAWQPAQAERTGSRPSQPRASAATRS
jgi:5'-nucleotidase